MVYRVVILSADRYGRGGIPYHPCRLPEARGPMAELLSYTESEIRAFLKKLRFPQPIENAFIEYYHEKTVVFVRYGILFGTLLYMAHVFTDMRAYPNLVRQMVAIRLGIGAVGIFFFIMTFLDSFKRYIQAVSLVTLIMASMGLVVITVIGGGIFAHLYHSGIMLCLVALFAFLRLRFVHVITGGMTVITAYVLMHIFIARTDTAILTHNASNMLGIIAIGVFISYFHEYYIRQGYIQALQLEASGRKLESRNRIIERDLEHARSIQQKYMPVTRPSDYIFALYRPMDMVGGDYFHFIPLEGGDRTGIFISDVSGHGMPAAMITSMLRISISRAGGLREDPQGLLNFLNGMLHGEIGNNFITCIYGILDRASRTFTFANAGHCSPLVMGPDGVHAVTMDGRVPLAVFGNDYLASRKSAYINQTERIPEGGRLLLCTDGLLETTRPGQREPMFEYNGLHAALRDLVPRTAEEIVRGIYGHLVEFRGSETFEDDICIICAEL